MIDASYVETKKLIFQGKTDTKYLSAPLIRIPSRISFNSQIVAGLIKQVQPSILGFIHYSQNVQFPANFTKEFKFICWCVS